MIEKGKMIRGVLTEVAFVSIFIGVIWIINLFVIR